MAALSAAAQRRNRWALLLPTGHPDVWLPADVFTRGVQFHGDNARVDERIPVEAVEFGTRAIYQALQRFSG